jgi:hypothetical protein
MVILKTLSPCKGPMISGSAGRSHALVANLVRRHQSADSALVRVCASTCAHGSGRYPWNVGTQRSADALTENIAHVARRIF